MKTILLVCLLFAFAAQNAAADVVLKSGIVKKGEVVQKDSESLTLRDPDGNELVIPLSMVADPQENQPSNPVVQTISHTQAADQNKVQDIVSRFKQIQSLSCHYQFTKTPVGRSQIVNGKEEPLRESTQAEIKYMRLEFKPRLVSRFH